MLRANQVWAPYPDNDPDAAREYIRRFYELVADPTAVPPEDVHSRTQQQALAMVHSDGWVAEGCHPASSLIADRRAALVRSYTGLRNAVSG